MKLKKPKFLYFLTYGMFYNCVYFSNSGKLWIWYFEKHGDNIMFNGKQANYNCLTLHPNYIKIISEDIFVNALTKQNVDIQEAFFEFYEKFSK